MLGALQQLSTVFCLFSSNPQVSVKMFKMQVLAPSFGCFLQKSIWRQKIADTISSVLANGQGAFILIYLPLAVFFFVPWLSLQKFVVCYATMQLGKGTMVELSAASLILLPSKTCPAMATIHYGYFGPAQPKVTLTNYKPQLSNDTTGKQTIWGMMCCFPS